MLLKVGRVIFDTLYSPEFRRYPLRAQLDKIREILELAVSDNVCGGVFLAMAVAMLDHVDGDRRQDAESSASGQADV
jgi:hypothetical protein